MNRFIALIVAVLALASTRTSLRAAETTAETPRQIIARATLAEDGPAKRAIITSLIGQGDEVIGALLAAWRGDALFIYDAPDGTKIPIQLSGPKDAEDSQLVTRITDGKPLTDAAGKQLRLVGSNLTAIEHDTPLRKAMKSVTDLLNVASPDPKVRATAVETLGKTQDPEKLPILRKRLEIEKDATVKRALREAIALTQLKDPSDAVQLAALNELAELTKFSSAGFVFEARAKAEADNKPELAAAARAATRAIESHRSTVDFFGTLFRGVSLGSILLVVALGLAITFGLMGVINMAHGEMIAVGAYTTYVVQNIFGDGTSITIPFTRWSLPLPGMHLTGWGYQSYFIFAIPLSFLAAALAGVVLERSIIRYLYRRSLESLLATWGVSLVLQQLFRLSFGPNNVQVSSPSYLSGTWTINDVDLGWNRLFVVGFVTLIVLGVWLVLTKTSLGLLMRAVTQNRGMAACMGVRTTRVNMLTFGLGSGLAGLAGAFLSQIGNVGPVLGQTYIVKSFMVVVLGGVGSIPGTVVSAFGIGGVDQMFQQYLPAWAPALAPIPYVGNFLQNLGQDSAVFGEILVLFGIILFLQWRPAGIFVTRSRSLEG